MIKFVLNAATCPCERKQLLISLNRHDYRTCQCGEVSVDGGLDYLKRSGEGLIEESIVKLEDGTFKKLINLNQNEQRN